jgi:hypothetical protein
MVRTITERGLKEFRSLTQGYVLERQDLAITHSAATWLALSASPQAALSLGSRLRGAKGLADPE